MKTARLLAPVLILPGTVLVLVPALILWLTWGTRREAEMPQAALPCSGMPCRARPRTPHTPRTKHWRFQLAIVFGAAGLILAISTFRLFVTRGEGTPAPWDPPQKLVVRGPYRHVRNPMISGVLLLLAAQAVFFSSWAVAGWLLVFFLANALYLPLIEEKGLERRFGAQYLQYKANVPRWIPRIRPWRQP